MSEDFSVFFDLTTPGSLTATVSGQSVVALFDNDSAATLTGQMGGHGVAFSGMAGSKPCLTLATASVPADPVGAAVTANATSYLIAAHDHDGSGVSKLWLELA